MEVIKSSTFLEVKNEPVVLALGSFDGLHLGHQAVINKTIDIANEKRAMSGVYTFNPHPLKVLKPALAPPSLMSSRQRIEFLSSMGVHYYFEQKFTPDFARIDYESFIKDYLVDRLNAVHLVIGEDFRFGKKSRGNVEILKEYSKKYGFGVTGLKTVNVDTRRVSSTLIRKLIKRGEIGKIPDYLGRYYRLDGKVVHGEGRGRKIGIPTANLKLATDYALPPNGVYATYVYYQGQKYGGITNFGNKPTFSNNDYAVEVHIFDFPEQDIYGDKLSIELVDFIRDEVTFSSTEELKAQIEEDILYTQSLLCYN